MKLGKALVSGLIGAVALTAVHETARRVAPKAPRMDVLGMRAIAQTMRAGGETPPQRDDLHTLALAGDIVANAAYYSLVGVGNPKGAWWRGAALGAVAGVGGVALPGLLGLGSDASARSRPTEVMTVAWYTIGGLAAGAAYGALAGQSDD